MSSFIAAGTAYATHGVPTIPFFIYYSMFGFQRIGDLIWAAGRHARAAASCSAAPPAARRSTARACSTRTATATSWPRPCRTCVAYDPAFAYELAVIVQDGIRRMYEDGERRLLLPHALQRELPDAADAGRARAEGILQGHVQASAAPRPAVEGQDARSTCSAAARSCARRCGPRRSWPRSTASPPTSGASPATRSCAATRWTCERWNLLHPTEPPRQSYLEKLLAKREGRVRRRQRLHEVAAGDDPALGARRPVSARHRRLRPQRRPDALRRFFEVDAEFIVAGDAYPRLAVRGECRKARVQKAIQELGIDPEKLDPMKS